MSFFHQGKVLPYYTGSLVEARRSKQARDGGLRTNNHCDAPQPSCPRLSRASTSLLTLDRNDVDGRDKPGHDQRVIFVALIR